MNVGRGGYNPYRHGVLIGNFVEDIFGTDLKKKYRTQSQQGPRPFPISEAMDKYRWPVPKIDPLPIKAKNELTINCGSDFDLNIDFTKKNVQDFLKLTKENDYVLDNKNSFLPLEIQQDAEERRLNHTISGTKTPRNIFTETQDRLKQFHMKDATGVLYTKKLGLNSNLLFGHGLDQRKFGDNEYASTYHLTMNKKERTETFYQPRYKVRTPFMHPVKTMYDNKDWGFRKFKTYQDFTKHFDKATCLEK